MRKIFALCLVAALFGSACLFGTKLNKDWSVGVIVLHHGAEPTPEPSPTVFPRGTPTQPCNLAFKSPVMHADRGQKVAWAVLNTCGDFNIDLAVLGFSYVGGPSPTPVATPRPLYANPFQVTVDNRLKAIIAKVPESAELGTYTYHLTINGKKVDPTFIIDK
jgi:hypothetical protein